MYSHTSHCHLCTRCPSIDILIHIHVCSILWCVSQKWVWVRGLPHARTHTSTPTPHSPLPTPHISISSSSQQQPAAAAEPRRGRGKWRVGWGVGILDVFPPSLLRGKTLLLFFHSLTHPSFLRSSSAAGVSCQLSVLGSWVSEKVGVNSPLDSALSSDPTQGKTPTQ